MSNHIHDNVVIDYLENLLVTDRARLLRIITFIKVRILEEEAKCEATDAIRKAMK